MDSGGLRRRGRAKVGGALLLLVTSMAALIGTAIPAEAATFTNSATITLLDPNCTDPDAAVPYPSNINVSGLTGTVSDVNVTLHGVNHAFQGDIEVLLVGPGGGSQNLEVLSDAGTGSFNNATLTFDDSAASQAPQNNAWAPGTYKPTNYTELSGADTFPAPAPAPSNKTTFATAFNGIAPNGTWALFVTDDACPDAGSFSGGWSLDITTAGGAVTSTSVTSSLNPSRTGQSVTFTAAVTSAGTPVTAGTVTFTEGTTTLAANVAVNGSGRATFSTSSLAEGNHVVTATYNGTASFATSSGTVNQRVDNNTTVNGSTFCNTGPVTINDNGPATPYPSNIFVTGLEARLTKVTVTLKNVSHTFDGDVEAMLVSPAGENVVVVSDAGTAAVSNVTVNLDDAAAGSLPATGSWAGANATITVKPTNHSELVADTFPAPAPAPSSRTTLGSLAGPNPNGTWSLYVNDDGAPDTGSIAGGWCLNIQPREPEAVADFDGDGETDISSFRPSVATWFHHQAPASIFGTSGDLPVPGDYDGDGDTERAVFRPSNGVWFVQDGAAVAWGTSGDVPVPGDYDADGDTDIAVYRPSSGVWLIRGGTTVHYGTTDDIPVVADYDGNGTADIAVYRPASGVWLVRGGISVHYGTTGDIPVPGDYTGDGRADAALFRDGLWLVRGGTASVWGADGDVPAPGDYDGDGDVEAAVFRPSSGYYFVTGGTTTLFGMSGDQPLPLPSAIHDVFF